MSICIVILAAGSSSRMGQSKQLLRIGQEVMLRNAIKTALSSKADHCVVVLGSNADTHKDAIADLDVQVVINSDWQRGMGSSLKAGLKSSANKNTEAILVMLSDQPAITTEHVDNIIDIYHQSRPPIVAAQYSGSIGVPALIDHSLFDDVTALDDKSGAKVLLTRYNKQAHMIAIPEAAIDLDTQEDYRRYTSGE